MFKHRLIEINIKFSIEYSLTSLMMTKLACHTLQTKLYTQQLIASIHSQLTNQQCGRTKTSAYLHLFSRSTCETAFSSTQHMFVTVGPVFPSWNINQAFSHAPWNHMLPHTHYFLSSFTYLNVIWWLMSCLPILCSQIRIAIVFFFHRSKYLAEQQCSSNIATSNKFKWNAHPNTGIANLLKSHRFLQQKISTYCC